MRNDEAVIKGGVRRPKLVEWYQQEAMRTAARPQDDDPEFHFRHAIVGIMTEAGELVDIYKKTAFQGRPYDTGKAVDELGDICWYLALACEALDIDLVDAERAFSRGEFTDETYRPDPDTPPAERLLLVSGAICVAAVFLLQRACVRSTPETREEQYALDMERGVPVIGNILQMVSMAAQIAGSDIEAVLRGNIAKLRVRFPENFDANRVEAKDEAAERAAVRAELE